MFIYLDRYRYLICVIYMIDRWTGIHYRCIILTLKTEKLSSFYTNI